MKPNSKWCLCVALLCACVPVWSQREDSGPGLGVHLGSVFGETRRPTEDVIYFANSDVLRGEVANDSLHLVTPYGEIEVPVRRAGGISFEGSDQAKETYVGVNGDEISGIFTERVILFRIGSAGAEVPIRKEKIRHIILRRSPLESPYIVPKPGSYQMEMSNGDRLKGQPLEPAVALRTEYGEVTVPFEEVSSMDFATDAVGTVRIRKTNGEALSGLLQTDEISLQANLGFRIPTVYRGRFRRIGAIEEAGTAVAIVEDRRISLEDLPGNEEMKLEPPEISLPETELEPQEEMPATETPTLTPTVTIVPPTPTTTATATPVPTEGLAERVYEDSKYGFRVEKPAPSWKIITGESELKELNEDAVVAFQSEEGVYAMVIVETLPGVPFDQYVEAVSPDLETVKLETDERGTLSGLTARKRMWKATHNGVEFRFFYTLIEKSDFRIQMVCYVDEASLSETVQKEIRAFEDSFLPTDAAPVEKISVDPLGQTIRVPPRPRNSLGPNPPR